MTNGISNLWLQFLQNNLVVLSWGISHISQSNSLLTFYVNGMHYKGKITIEWKDECYNILHEKTSREIKQIRLEDVIRVIDGIVENNHIGATYKQEPVSQEVK